MSTGGFYGFCKNNKYKFTRMTHDAYLEGFGNWTCEFIKNTSIKELNKIYDNIITVNLDVPLNKEIIQNYIDVVHEDEDFNNEWLEMILSDRNPIEFAKSKYPNSIKWWDYISDIGADFDTYKQGYKYMLIANEPFETEYGYIINLDTKSLEIYTFLNGFKTKKKFNGYSLFKNVLFEKINDKTIKKMEKDFISKAEKEEGIEDVRINK